MAEVKIIPLSELKSGMLNTEEIRDENGNILLEANNPFSNTIIRFLKKKNIKEVKIILLDKPNEELPPLENTELKDMLERIINAILFFDPEIDKELNVKRMMTRLSTLKKNEIIEACDYILEFFDDKRSKELAIQALETIKSPYAVPTIITALLDNEPTIRVSAQKMILNYIDIITVKKLIYLIEECNDENIKKEILGIFSNFDINKLKPILNELEKTWKEDNKKKAIISQINDLFKSDEEEDIF